MTNNLESLFSNLRQNYSPQNFSPETLKSFITNFSILWKDIIEYIKNENTYVGKTPFLENDFTYNSSNDNDRNDSLIGYISKQIDLNNSLFNSLINTVKDNIDLTTKSGVGGNNYFWNESVNYCLAYVLKQLDSKNNLQEIISGGVRNFYLDELKKADAAQSFQENSEWVSPWKNIDNNSYSQVRTVLDNVLSVLTNSKNLDFTAEDNSDWIRLLMPKNIRRVEVEDLNRDFWSIGQVTSIISAYLFNDNSPINNAIKMLLNEIIQCWQNILYLYGLYSILLQGKYYTNVHTEIVYLPTSPLQPYKKYDNFDNNTDIINKLKYLTYKYPNYHLCILPCCRRENYKHNYYKVEEYPCIVFYNANTKEWSSIQLQFSNGKPIRFSFNSSDSGVDYKTKVYGIKEVDNGYLYLSPFSNLSNLLDTSKKTYYGALRIIPSISATFSNNIITITNLTFKVEDAAKKAVKNGDTLLTTCTKGEGAWSSNLNNQVGKVNLVNQSITVDQQGFASFTGISNNSLYLGEVVTTGDISKEENRANYVFTSYNVVTPAQIIFVGGYMPLSELSNGARVGLYTDPDGTLTNIKSYYTPYFNTGVYDHDTDFTVADNWNFYHNNNFANRILTNQSIGSAYTKVASVDNNALKNRFCDYTVKKLNDAGLLNKSGIQYFLTEYGANYPWVGGTGESTEIKTRIAKAALGSDIIYSGRMYWSDRVVAHLFRYIPYGTPIKSNGRAVYGSNGVRIGTVEIFDIGVVDRAYNWGQFLSDNDHVTWRSPTLYYGNEGNTSKYYYYTKTDILTGIVTSGYITENIYNQIFTKEGKQPSLTLSQVGLSTQTFIENNTVSDLTDIYGDTFQANFMIEDYNDTEISGQSKKNNVFNKSSNAHTERVWIKISQRDDGVLIVSPYKYQDHNGVWQSASGQSLGRYIIGNKTGT